MRFIERPRPEIERVHTEKKEQAKSHKPRLELRSEALNLWVSHTPSFPGLQVTNVLVFVSNGSMSARKETARLTLTK